MKKERALDPYAAVAEHERRRILHQHAGTWPAITSEMEITHVDGLRAVTEADLRRLDPLGKFRECRDLDPTPLDLADTDELEIDPEDRFVVTELGRAALERARRGE